MLNVFIYIIIFLLSVPTTYILSKLCEDEIKNWKKRFNIIAISSLILAVIIYFIPFNYKLPVSFSLLFIFFVFIEINFIWKN